MTVKYFATIRTYTGETARRVDDAPADLRELLTQLAERYGAPFRRAVFSADDAQRRDHHPRQRAQRALPAGPGHAARGGRRGLDLPHGGGRLTAAEKARRSDV